MKTIRLAWRIVKFSPMRFLISFIAYVLFYCFPLLFALLTSRFFDLLSGQVTAGFNVWTMLAFIGATEVGRILTQTGAVKYWAQFASVSEALLRANMLHSQLYDRPSQAPLSPGEAVNRFGGDVDKITSTIETWVDGGGTIVYVLLTFVVMFRIEWRLALVVLILGAAIVLLTRLMYTRVAHMYGTSRQATEAVTGFLGEILNSVQAIKLATAEGWTGARFRYLGDRRRKAEVKSAVMQVLVESFMNTSVASLGTGFLLLLSAHALQDDRITVGNFSLFIMSMTRLTDRLRFIGRMMVELRQSSISFERMAELVHGGEEALVSHRPVYLQGNLPTIDLPTPEPPFTGLTVKGLTYHYPDGSRGIEGIDLIVSPGVLTVVTGRIGSGKSTLLKALIGLLPPSEGEIRWNGSLVTDPTAFFVPPRTAYTPQVPHLFSGSIAENILMGLSATQADLLGAVHHAALTPDIDSMEQGLQTIIGPRGARLSGGQVQRTAAARMLVRHPQLLLVDDLSSALDVETEQSLWERILTQGQVACLAVSHRKSVLHRAAHIILLKDGYVEAAGTPAQLLQTSSEFQRLWDAAPT